MGMISEVFFAAMIPATLATAKTSPFAILPDIMLLKVFGFMKLTLEPQPPSRSLSF